MLVTMLPALACAITPQLNHVEQDCCRQMHGQCGEMAKQGCCQVKVGRDVSLATASVPAIANPLPHMVVECHFLTPAVVLPSTGYLWQLPQEHSPPGLLIASTTLLLI